MDEHLHIITPFYESRATLERTILSLECIAPSSRHRVRLIGVDDGSSDDSGEIFERTAARVEGINYELLRKENGGSASARNLALGTFSRGWTLFLDADDELIADPFPALDEHAGSSLVSFAAELWKDGGVVGRTRAVRVKENDVPAVLTSRNPFPPVSLIFERSALENLMDEDLVYLEDWHFWAVNPALFRKSAICPTLAIGRVHAGVANKTSDQHQNGRFRITAAEKIGTYWQGRLRPRERNNLTIQKAIGRIQMGGPRSLRAFLTVPASLSLYGKLIIYSFFYGVYRRFYLYARRDVTADVASG